MIMLFHMSNTQIESNVGENIGTMIPTYSALQTRKQTCRKLYIRFTQMG